ncbi:LodA/GoxA family CTQ-dependent oxidase [Sphaerisporangium sp. NPDC005288]|uniref:LodA/GoxA family CTQ-dependent oxidase n=1 Tax=Sphaerisporangium sp. NPDC005288 TaxID=3155114 RepID=UPI0033BDD4DE
MSYRIHPAVGVVRVGNSPEFYLAPERPGTLPVLPGGGAFTPADFRDARGALRRQGERFEVYLYRDEADPGRPVRPGEDGVERIEWTVHLANKKAIWYEFMVNAGESGYAPDHPLRNAAVTDPAERQKMIIDPGPRTLKGPGESVAFSRTDNPGGYPMTFPPEDLKPATIDSLGEMRTDELGRLIVLGGFGSSGSADAVPVADDYANNDNWWDDTSDGPVTARLIMRDGREVDVDDSAWVLAVPPRFAPELSNLVTLYDTISDMAVRNLGTRPEVFADGLWQRDFTPDWEGDIKPILERAHHYGWVVAIPTHPHDMDFGKLGDPSPVYAGMRRFYLDLIRPPDAPDRFASPDSGLPLMPFLAGDNCFEPGPLSSRYLTLTRTQFFYLQQWAAGNFTTKGSPEPSPGALRDRVALENCVGGAFSPGIEMTWICRNPRLYSAPYRIRRKTGVRPPLSLGQDLDQGLEPGDLSKYMAVPWQADFNECSEQQVGDRFLWWWPVQRPDFVYVEDTGGLRQVAWVGSDGDQNADDYVRFADDVEMVELWHRLGFVVNKGTADDPVFVEVERTLPRDTAPPEGP